MIVSEMFIQPRRIKIISDENMNYYVRNFNGRKNIYRSVYDYRDYIDTTTAIVDKIFLDFDFDSDMVFLNDVRTVAEYLYQKDYLFYIRFSGNGFHIFILIKDNLNNPAPAIKQYVNFLHKQTNTTSDPAVIGDLRRVTRVPNTLNIKNKKRYYCISLSYDELMTYSYEDIRTLAKQPRNCQDIINGHRFLDISEWDHKAFERNNNYDKQKQIMIRNNIINDDIPPCVQSMMQQPDLGNLGRIQVILFFRDLGYDKDEIEDILYGFLSDEKFHHSVFEERQIDYLFEKDYLFGDCHTLKENGFCTDSECKGHNVYY